MKDVNHRHSEEQREAKRAAIVAAATRLMLARGPRVEVDEIAREAGIGKGTVYLYFGSKDQITRAVRSDAEASLPSVLDKQSEAAALLHLILEIAMLNRQQFARDFPDSHTCRAWVARLKENYGSDHA